MCLYPKLIRNPKYLANKKNEFNPPELKDLRVGLVPVGCGKCIECLKQKAQSWRVRLNEELKVSFGYYVTLTFSCEDLENLCKKYELKESNAVAAKAVRLFLERWRKDHKKSVKHWLVTELGHENTERIHLHGIIFTDKLDEEKLTKYWKYGNVRIGEYCNGKTINYIIKYIHKLDTDHKGFCPIILCSAGLGKNYINAFTKQLHNFKGKNSIEYYRLPNGQKVNLPIYYRNKLFNEEQRELLWIDKIEKGKRYVLGTEIDIRTDKGIEQYNRILAKAQQTNKEVGFGDDSKEWQKKDYNVTLRMLNKQKRVKNFLQQYYKD